MAGSRWAGPFERSLSPSNPGRFRHGSKVARLGTGTALVACLFIDSITAQQQQTNKTRGGTDTDNDTQTLLNGVSAQSTSTSASSAANGQTPWVTALLCVVFSLIGLFMIWRYGIRRCLANRRVSKKPSYSRRYFSSSAYDLAPASADDDVANQIGVTLSKNEVNRIFPEVVYDGPYPDQEAGTREISLSYREMQDAEARLLTTHGGKTSSSPTSSPTSPSTLPTTPLPNQSECLICLLPFHPRFRNRVSPCCRRTFHSDCLLTWLTRQKGSCPVCRYEYARRGVEHVEGVVNAGYREYAAAHNSAGRLQLRRAGTVPIGGGGAPTVLAIADSSSSISSSTDLESSTTISVPEPALLVRSSTAPAGLFGRSSPADLDLELGALRVPPGFWDPVVIPASSQTAPSN